MFITTIGILNFWENSISHLDGSSKANKAEGLIPSNFVMTISGYLVDSFNSDSGVCSSFV